MSSLARRLTLHAQHRADRLRMAWLRRSRAELEIDPAASPNLVHARFTLAPGSRLRIGAGVVTERRAGALQFLLAEGAEVEIGAGTWLRTELAPVSIVADVGARLVIGAEGFLNGCHVSAKASVRLGAGVTVGIGSRIFDADQHDLDDDTPEQQEPVEIGDHCWIAADSTVLRGARIGAHSVVGARSLVNGEEIPPHSLAVGQPARVIRSLGDRSRCR